MNKEIEQEINDKLESAYALKQTANDFIDIAIDINNDARIRLEDERDIDIDSKRGIPLDDIPLGEELIRVEEELPNLDNIIQILEDIIEGKTDVDEKYHQAIEDLSNAQATLQDVNAEKIVKDYSE